MSARPPFRTRAPWLASLLLLAACARAAPPSIRYSWDDCAPIALDRDFVGATHYAQTLSVVGLTQPLTSFRIDIAIGASQPSAWQFYDFGCQGASRLTASSAAAGCEAILGNAVTLSMDPGLTDFRLHVRVLGFAPAGANPDPALRYLLARLDFDHTHTTGGFIDPPGQCAAGDALQCFAIEYVELNGAAVRGVDYGIENGGLTWNLPASPGQCPFAVPTRPSTWGSLKALYR